MGRKKRDKLEFRFYEIPQGESVLALYGEQWIGTYGHNDICMHFHNLLEIGYCHHGRGLLVLDELQAPGKKAMPGKAFLSGYRNWVISGQ